MTISPLTPEDIDGGKLDEHAAKALDRKIREASKKLATDVDALLNMLEQAKAGQLHEALGYPSWPAYVCDAVRIAPTDKTERKMLAALMSCEGMSQRAIAAVLDVDQKTVSDDLRAGEESSSAVTAGLDGKNHPRKRPHRRRPITEAWSEAVDKLTKDAQRMTNITEDDRFAKNRMPRRSDLQRAIEALQAVMDKLGTAAAETES